MCRLAEDFKMALDLQISVDKSGCTVAMQFDQRMSVCDVCKLISSRLQDNHTRQFKCAGLFKPFEGSTMGYWLNQDRTLEYYNIKSDDKLLYKIKDRPLRVRTLDGSIKTLLIDESQTVAEITKVVCAKIGLHNPEEFSLASDEETPEKLLQRMGYKVRNQKKLDTLRKKLHTDNELNWLNMDKPLCEQGVEESTTLTLRKKFFFSDQNVQSNDPVQLNLLYVQMRDAIINGTHPCTRNECVHLAALQCQIQHGNYSATKHQPGYLELHRFLPPHLIKQKGIETSIFAEHRKLINLNELNAKYRYIQFCRSLRTYGVTFFLVKEKMHHPSKLVPRLLGISRDSVMRVDEKTKEVLKTWPFTVIRSWAATSRTFTLDFGEYSKSTYSVQTTEGEAIIRLIRGYVDIITRTRRRHESLSTKDEEKALVMEDDHKCCMTNAKEKLEVMGVSPMESKIGQGHKDKKQDGSERTSATDIAACLTKELQGGNRHLGAKGHSVSTEDVDYQPILIRAPMSSSKQLTTTNESHQNDTSGYMRLIKTQRVTCDELDDYQPLLARGSLSECEPDYDYADSLENIYQPLLLDNVKDGKGSCDSIYQALFSCTDQQTKKNI